MATLPVILLNGTTADANQVMADFYEIYDNITNDNISAIANIQVTKLEDLTENYIWIGNVSNKAAPQLLSTSITSTVNSLIQASKYLPPVGSIIPFYDFGISGPGGAPLTFDTSTWAYCNGQTKTISGTPCVLPDLSGRYLAGFGTVGGSDIGTATWDIAAIGANSINIQHSHTGPSHNHTGPNHNHSFSGTTDGIPHGGNYANFQTDVGGRDLNLVDDTDHNGDHVHPFSGATEYGGTGSTDFGGTGATSSSLSTTQDIRPNSIRVRYIMRYA